MFSRQVCCAVFISILMVCAANLAISRTFDQIVAYVNDEVITYWELENLVRQRALELSQIHNFSKREAAEKAQQERSELLDRLIRQMLLVETALTLKVEITNEELETHIKTFKQRAKIETQEEFVKQLKAEGLTVPAFREQSKRNLMAERLLERRIFPRLQVRDSDVLEYFEQNRDRFTTKADILQLRHILVAFKPSEADRKEAFKMAEVAHRSAKEGADFEALAKQYSRARGARGNLKPGPALELSLDEIDKLPKPFRDSLRTLTENEIGDPVEDENDIYIIKVERKTGQTIKFRYLAIKLTVGEEGIQSAQERADLVYQKLLQGEDFNSLASRYSDDIQTRANGGDLGSHSLNELTAETQSAVERLEIGEFQAPVKMRFGFHIFKVDSRSRPELNDAERNQIRSMLRQQKFEEEWKSYTDMLLENAYVKIKSLDQGRLEP
ncbi:MAG: peptidylprolyl isomerase [Candidatus Poribacteria bacterium]|nr:peptidylprolyl isomerase [Candidatus Poribacteria bacterium]